MPSILSRLKIIMCAFLTIVINIIIAINLQLFRCLPFTAVIVTIFAKEKIGGCFPQILHIFQYYCISLISGKYSKKFPFNFVPRKPYKPYIIRHKVLNKFKFLQRSNTSVITVSHASEGRKVKGNKWGLLKVTSIGKYYENFNIPCTEIFIRVIR